jgi:hypothetical protein
MASTIRTVAKWSESAGTDKGQAGDMKRPGPRTRSEISSSIHARELVWLDEIRRGYSIKEIARREGLGCRRIQHGVSRARERGNQSHIRESRRYLGWRYLGSDRFRSFSAQAEGEFQRHGLGWVRTSN